MPLSPTDQPQPTTESLSRPAMNRHLATVIDFTGSLSWCDAVQLAQGPKSVGMPTVAYAHDLGRECHDTNPSGEGPG